MSTPNSNTPLFPSQAVAISASDTAAFGPAAVYVGTGGAVACRPAGSSSDVTFAGIPNGSVIPVMVTAIRSTGTTASNFVAVY